MTTRTIHCVLNLIKLFAKHSNLINHVRQINLKREALSCITMAQRITNNKPKCCPYYKLNNWETLIKIDFWHRSWGFLSGLLKPLCTNPSLNSRISLIFIYTSVLSLTYLNLPWFKSVFVCHFPGSKLLGKSGFPINSKHAPVIPRSSRTYSFSTILRFLGFDNLIDCFVHLGSTTLSLLKIYLKRHFATRYKPEQKAKTFMS